MKSSRIRHIVSELAEHVCSNCHDVAAGFDPEAIHRFRVAIKTFRSMLRLLKTQENTSGLKIPGKMKKLYHIAGHIREAQLEIEELDKIKLRLPGYTNHLLLSISRYKAEWEGRYAQKTLDDFLELYDHINYEKTPPAALPGFINKNIAALHAINTTTSLTDEEVHSIRKLAKDMQYTSRIAEKKWKATHKLVQDLPMDLLDELTKLTGDHNDKRLLLDHLTSFLPHTSAAEQGKIKRYVLREQKKMPAVRQLIAGIAAQC